MGPGFEIFQQLAINSFTLVDESSRAGIGGLLSLLGNIEGVVVNTNALRENILTINYALSSFCSLTAGRSRQREHQDPIVFPI